LRFVAVGVLAVIMAVVFAISLLNSKTAEPVTASESRSSLSTIAVYPFDSLANGDEVDYFASGLSENLIFRLSHIPGLRVISTTTANAIKKSNLPIEQLKNKYGIGAVLKGSIQKSQNHVRVIVQLTNTTDGGVLWSTRFDKPLDDVFSIQDAIAQAIGETLRVKLTSISMPQGVTVAAFDHYLIGRFYWNKRHQRDTRLAIEHFNKAIEISPDYAQAHAGLGDSYIFLNAYGDMPMDEAYGYAREHLNKALELNPALGDALASLGQMQMNLGDTKAAEKLFIQAIKANANYVLAYHWYGILLNNLGRHDEALKQHNMAMILDPLSPIVNRNMAFSQLLNGHKIKAKHYFDESLALAPIFFGKEFLALGFEPLEKQSAQKAIVFVSKHYQAIPDMVPHKVTLSLLATSVGAYQKAQLWINQAQQLVPGHPRIIDAKIALKAALEQWHEVINLLRQRQQTQPDNASLYLQMAYAHYLNNDLQSVKSLIKSTAKQLEGNPRFKLLQLLVLPQAQKSRILDQLQANNDVSIVNAAIYSFKGDQAQALGILEKMLKLGWVEDASRYWWSFNDDPALAHVKQHPQFA
ncbi:MAG: FlgO family outer membrane protein, partial [Psychrosphaera sp.]|nr:FlgO family outer membrane protein [Psychrosphaera sp.]